MATLSFNKAKSYLSSTQKEKGSWETGVSASFRGRKQLTSAMQKYRPILPNLPVLQEKLELLGEFVQYLKYSK